MKLRPIASTAAVTRTGRNPTDYRLTKATNRLASTFIAWQKAYIHQLAELEVEERYALGVLLTMSVCEREDLAGIGVSGAVYHPPEGPTLEWLRPDGRRGARLLSSLVLLSDVDGFDPRCRGQFVRVLESALRKLDAGLQLSDDPIEAALTCSEAWCFQELTDFFSHLSGDLPMTPLPGTAYVRLESMHALSAHFEGNLSDEDDAAAAIGAFLQSAGNDKDSRQRLSTLTNCWCFGDSVRAQHLLQARDCMSRWKPGCELWREAASLHTFIWERPSRWKWTQSIRQPCDLRSDQHRLAPLLVSIESTPCALNPLAGPGGNVDGGKPNRKVFDGHSPCDRLDLSGQAVTSDVDAVDQRQVDLVFALLPPVGNDRFRAARFDDREPARDPSATFIALNWLP